MTQKTAPDKAKLFATLGIAAVLIGLGITVFYWISAQGGDDRFAQCRSTKIAGGSSISDLATVLMPAHWMQRATRR